MLERRWAVAHRNYKRDHFLARRQEINTLAKEGLSSYSSKPRRVVKESKYALKVSKDEYQKAKKAYRVLQQSSPEEIKHSYAKRSTDKPVSSLDDERLAHYSKRRKEATHRLKEAKKDYHIHRKTHHLALKNNGGTRKAKLAKKGYQSLRQTTEDATKENYILEDISESRQKIRRSKYGLKQSQRIGKYSLEFIKSSQKKNYERLNKSYNAIRGCGYRRTPKANRWETRLQNYLRKVRQRLARTRLGRVGKGTFKATKILSKPFVSILRNPLSLKSYLIAFGLIVIFALFTALFSPSPISQDEFDLNDSWLQVSKRDRERSTDKVDYWTNIDDILFYMNYRYGGEWNPKAKWEEGRGGKLAGQLGFNHFSDALNEIWNQLNDDKDHLKTMADLYGEKSQIDWLKLSKRKLAEYKDLLDTSKETGRYISYQELDNPFYDEDDESHYNEPLLILKRYGYTSKDKIYEGSQIKASSGQKLRAVFSGKVKLTKDDVTIETSDAKFTYKHVSGIRVKSGDKIKEGDEIGKVQDNGYEEVYFQKLAEKATKTRKAKWTYVNVGFYFAHVTYNQTTSVLSDLSLGGDLGNRARSIYQYVKKKLPDATDNGIAAILGNFATESSINPKRAEGDYLNPPVGASETSWDDEAWLALGGPAIYNGSYANILHRGLGLGQWTDTSDGAIRHSLLLTYAKKKQQKWYDLELQISFMLEGDSPYYINYLLGILKSHDDVATLTKRFLNNWEGNAGDKLLERQNNAQQMLQFFKQPSGVGGTLASSWNFPTEYEGKLKFSKPTQTSVFGGYGSQYAQGQCTFYVFNRIYEVYGQKVYNYLGNGQDWVRNLQVHNGWKQSPIPVAGAVVSTAGGFDFTYAQWGHVGFIEHVNEDGSFLVSELNYAQNQTQVHWRVCHPAPYYTYAIPG